MNSDIVSLIIILICVMLSAYFSATETSFTSLNRIRMKNMAEKGDKRAELVLKLLENFDKLLSTILVGNNIVNIGLSSLATVLFIKLLGGDSGATVSTIVTTIVVLIFGEVSPKSIAKESPETIAKFSAPFLHILMIMLTPVTFLFSQWKKLLSRIFKSSENHGITDEELMTIVEEATQEGDIDDQEGDLIQNAIGFMEMEAAEIFTPRVNVIGIPLAAGVFIPLGLTLNPMFGAAAMSLSSFCVVSNALRLNLFDLHSAKRDHPPKHVPALPAALVQPAAEEDTTQKEETAMKKTLTVEGMMCPHCEARVKKALEALPQVDEAVVSHEAGTAIVTLNAEVDDEVLKKAVEAQDYPVTSIQ